MMSWIEDGADKQHILPQAYWYDDRFNNFIPSCIFNFGWYFGSDRW